MQDHFQGKNLIFQITFKLRLPSLKIISFLTFHKHQTTDIQIVPALTRLDKYHPNHTNLTNDSTNFQQTVHNNKSKLHLFPKLLKQLNKQRKDELNLLQPANGRINNIKSLI